MRELDDMLHDLAGDTPLPAADELRGARTRLMQEIETISTPAAAHNRQPRGRVLRRRPLTLTAGVAVAAAAVIAAVIATTAGGTSPTAQMSHSPAKQASAHHARKRTNASSTQKLELRPLRHPTAKKVLDRAAFVALHSASVTPQPDQFIYTKIEQQGGAIGQTWSSVSGQQDSLEYAPGSKTPTTIAGCADEHRLIHEPGEDGKPLSDLIPKRILEHPITTGQDERVWERYFGRKTVPMDGPTVTVSCTAEPAFFPNMPTSASTMLAYLVKDQGVYTNQGTAVDTNDLAKQVDYLLETDYLLPAQQAALFQLLAATPGFTVKQTVTDAAGRKGIGVGWSLGGTESYLIFSSTTYQFLGINGPDGGDALLQTAIVNSAGEQPDQMQQSGSSGSTA